MEIKGKRQFRWITLNGNGAFGERPEGQLGAREKYDHENMGAVRACRHGCADCAGNEMPLVLGPDFAGLFWRFYDLCMGGSDEHRNPIFGARRTGHPPDLAGEHF